MQNRLVVFSIALISIVVLFTIGSLFLSSPLDIEHNLNLGFFPKFHAFLNSCVAICLLLGFYFIKNRNFKAHKTVMLIAFSLSSIFLISYLTYHSLSEGGVKYGDANFDGVLDDTEKMVAGSLRYVYYFVLLTHIVLAGFILPLILFTFYKALTNRFDEHKKIARWTFPLWLYVAITGVLVYVMIHPFYPY
ncbi:MAG: DUF420 domain-containing protein [Chitinophagales bacterium]|nr:DUF420 domain-containing protein [Chitinophagales bacterium]